MAKKEVVTKVWIEEGCIVCDACETTSPDVFEVQEETCIVRPEALNAEFTKPRSEEIADAAEECPTDVIKFETVAMEVSDTNAEAEADAAPASTAASATTSTAETPTEEKNAKVEPVAAPSADRSPTPAAKGKPKTAPERLPDPAIQALLRAATARGGSAGLQRQLQSTPESVEALRRKNPSDLPPDARDARTLAEAGRMAKNPDLDRRSVAGGAALAVGWTAFGVGTAVSVGPALARFMMPNVLEEPDPLVRVGDLARYVEMVPGGVDEDYKPMGIWMIREEARVAALSTICTHLGCIPNWLPNDRKFKCPCHGSGYRPNGINFEGPTPRPLERFRIYIHDGVVVVDKSRKYRYELGQWTMPGSFLEV